MPAALAAQIGARTKAGDIDPRAPRPWRLGHARRHRPAAPRLRHRDDGADPPRGRHRPAATGPAPPRRRRLGHRRRRPRHGGRPSLRHRGCLRLALPHLWRHGRGRRVHLGRRGQRSVTADVPLSRAAATCARTADRCPSTPTTSTARARSTPRLRGRRCSSASPRRRSGHALPGELVDLFPPRAQLALAAIIDAHRGGVARARGPVGAAARPRPHGPAHQPPLTATRVVSRPSASAPGRCAARPRVSGASATPGRSSRRARASCAPSSQAQEAGSADAGTRRVPTCAACSTARPTWPSGSACPWVARRSGRPRGRVASPGRGLASRRASASSSASRPSTGPPTTSPSPTSRPRWRSAPRPPPRCRWPASSGRAPRSDWARDALTLQRALGAVQTVLLPDAQVVLLLSAAEPEALVAAVIGAVGAGPALRRRRARQLGDRPARQRRLRPAPLGQAPAGRDVAIQPASDRGERLPDLGGRDRHRGHRRGGAAAAWRADPLRSHPR